MKWLPKLMEFDYEIIFKKGMENVSAKALSRIQNEAQLFSLLASLPVSTELLHRIEATWEEDPELKIDSQIEVVNRLLNCYLRCICGEKPKEWSKWLSLAEWWCNTNYHSVLTITPYEILYGQTHPIYIPYVSGESRVDTIDKTLTAREEFINALKFHLKRSQERMKIQADKHKSEREFMVDDWKLALPAQAQVHDVFNVSQLKKCKGQKMNAGILPQCDDNGLIHVQPVAILERKLDKVGNAAGVFVLVQWANNDPADAMWESIKDIQRLPKFASVLKLHFYPPVPMLQLLVPIQEARVEHVGKSITDFPAKTQTL
ncbi:retrotransposable element Tf2 [Tanacetum coccineum]|uniref:Retrotransposable element Tf2 n=1 Tax=Tanacetum coccineum TaxID=301880 RepID=A0ABQ5G0P2_9ASTR